MIRAIVARAGVSFAVVAFCMAVCAIAAWLAVGLPGTRFLTADTRSALAADYRPDEHVFSLPPLDSAIIEAAQNDLGVASQVVPPGDQARLLPSLPTPTPGALPPNAATQSPGQGGDATTATPKPGALTPTPTKTATPTSLARTPTPTLSIGGVPTTPVIVPVPTLPPGPTLPPVPTSPPLPTLLVPTPPPPTLPVPTPPFPTLPVVTPTLPPLPTLPVPTPTVPPLPTLPPLPTPLPIPTPTLPVVLPPLPTLPPIGLP